MRILSFCGLRCFCSHCHSSQIPGSKGTVSNDYNLPGPHTKHLQLLRLLPRLRTPSAQSLHADQCRPPWLQSPTVGQVGPPAGGYIAPSFHPLPTADVSSAWPVMLCATAEVTGGSGPTAEGDHV
ncbi:hypothetical protein WJX75_003586 [Coccomyxa subellipsoidea]|uniref:Secreted protein n=1 Tax=Coccomyxa subellipsoidea TaxID=248742 RepID=A0ABR2YMG0_9CHLO